MKPEDLVVLTRTRALTESGLARSIRLGAGLSLTEVAQAVGVSISTVHRWENAERKPTREQAVRYGRLLMDVAGAR